LSDESTVVTAQVKRLLGATLDDNALLGELKSLALAHEDDFAACASFWALALYERDSTFFGPFLVAYLDSKQTQVIQALLEQAEKDQDDELFRDLYQKIATEKTWNGDVIRLARSTLSDEEVAQALERREHSYSPRHLHEDAALALYKRNPARFGEYIRAHVRRGWGKRHEQYRRLRRVARARGDSEFYWALFRAFATDKEWQASVRQLLAEKPPASALLDELARRQPDRSASLDTKTLRALVRIYRDEALAYLERSLTSAPDDFINWARKLGDERFYWRIFFLAGSSTRWNADLRALLARPLSDDQLAEALALRTPPEEGRNWWRLEPDLAQAIYQRNSSRFGPFLDRFATGGLIALELPKRIQTALSTDQERGPLLHAMETLSHAPGFDESARVWAPALYEREPLFFEPFLINHLSSEQSEVIAQLLMQAEAAGQDSLFNALYRKVAREDAWNKELAELAESPLPDDTVVEKVLRRQVENWLSLTDATATALYRRAPGRLSSFIREHAQRSWRQEGEQYKQLRDAARARADDDLYWALFRELADEREWQAEMRRLLASDTPPEQIVAELTKRHPDNLWSVNTGIIADFVEKYGYAALPYVEEHLTWVTRHAAPKLLKRIKKLGDERLYWPIFFKAGDSKQWNEALRELLTQPTADAAFAQQLAVRTPPPQRWRGWTLERDVALALYRRDARLYAPFLERFADDSYADALFEEATAAHDEDFLDFLSLPLLREVASWLDMAYPTESTQRWRKPDMKFQDKVQRAGLMLTTRFDRLVAESPALYVRHTAAMLSRVDAFEIWSFKRNVTLNPALAYLHTQHREAWLAQPEALRELLESPNIYVQIIGLVKLGDSGADAAERTLENLPILRAILLGRAHLNTKKLALRALDLAARQGESYAGRILPVIEEASYLSGKGALDQHALVAYARLRHAVVAPQSA
jgi:hypothetical protein